MKPRDVKAVICALVALVALTMCANRVAAQHCDATCLRGFTQRYLDALSRSDQSGLPLARAVKFTENGQHLRFGEGLWKAPVVLGGYRFFIEDPSASRASFVGVLEQEGEPAILWLSVKVERGQITEVETIVARKGSHPLFAPQALTAPYPGFSESIAPSDRSSRKALIAVANSYLGGIERHDSRIVRADPACERIENGVKTTHRPDRPESKGCASSVEGFKHIKRVDHRRFPIVDRERGVVLAVFTFDIPGDSARTLLLMELFKIVEGRITRIEAVMHNLPHGSQPGWP